MGRTTSPIRWVDPHAITSSSEAFQAPVGSIAPPVAPEESSTPEDRGPGGNSGIAGAPAATLVLFRDGGHGTRLHAACSRRRPDSFGSKGPSDPCGVEPARPVGGRTWWAHRSFTRTNVGPIILRNQIEDRLEIPESAVLVVCISVGGGRILAIDVRSRPAAGRSRSPRQAPPGETRIDPTHGVCPRRRIKASSARCVRVSPASRGRSGGSKVPGLKFGL